LRGQPVPKVVAVGIDQGAAVAGLAPELFTGLGVALDGVECPTEPAAAFEQAHALVEQLTHRGVSRAGPVVDRPGRTRWSCPPAVAVGDDGLLHRAAKRVPQVPMVADLHGIRCALADRFSVRSGAVPADDLGARVLAQPLGEGGGLAVGQHVDPTVGDRVDHDGCVAVPASQCDVVDAEHSRRRRRMDW
jgi:hypothetical protein